MGRPEAHDFSALIGLATQRISKGQFAGARSSLSKALRLAPGSPTALELMGIVASELGNPREAVRYLERAAILAPSAFGVHLNLGKLLHLTGRIEDALAAFRTAATLGPNIPDVHLGYGGALVAADKLREAAERFREAIRLNPNFADAYYNMAKVLYELREYEAALSAWNAVLRWEPNSAEAIFKIAVCEQVLCAWKHRVTRMDALSTAIDEGRIAVGTAFCSLRAWDASRVHRRCANLEAKLQGAAQTVPSRKGAVKRRETIRLAYVSADFRNHATPILMAGLIENHSRGRFETIAVALNKDDGSAERGRLKKGADVFLDMHDASGDTIARQLQEHQIDIAIDLMGHTQNARPSIFAHRAAPIQVNFLGFPGTSGVPAIDYIVVDPVICSAAVKGAASEKLVILPDCYQCNDRSRPTILQVPARSSYGLPEGAFVFGSFNQQAKITPQTFDVWMSILQKVANGSVLWLLVDGEKARANLRVEAEVRGVSPSRLVFADKTDLAAHIARLSLIDLQLDTFPYTAHTTASDALWAGCPIVTLAGESFASRVCASLLMTIGVPELIANSWADYEKMAVYLAQNRDALNQFKTRIAQGKETSPLFDISRFCRNLERAYEEMVAIAVSGAQPKEIDVRNLI